jgi:lysophospholipase L1-like esterase
VVGDVERTTELTRLFPMRRLLTAVLGLGLVTLSACTSTESQAQSEDAAGAPLPTIGIGSEVGQISGGADVRAVDANAVQSIVMIGDSITVGATAALDEQFAQLGFDDVMIVAQSSKRMVETSADNTSGAEIARFVTENQARSGSEQLWVIALGTNDIGKYADVTEVVSIIDEVLAPIPPDAPVIWVNTYLEANQDGAAEVNAAIELVIAARGNANVGRWSDIAPADGVLSSDGIHPGNDGAVVFATLVTTTVSNFLK